MAQLALALASIGALAALAALARRRWPGVPCPACVGVAATWLAMLAARAAGLTVDGTILAVLLGMSVVGAAQAVESKLPPQRSPLLWKALALPIGAGAAYGLATAGWLLAALAGAAFALLAAGFMHRGSETPRDPAAVARLEERMKRCC